MTTAAFTAVEDNGEPGQDLTPADLVRSLPQPLVELILDFHVDKLIFGPDSLRAHLERTKTLDASTNLLLARRLLYTLERGPIHQLERLVWSRRPILHGANPLFRCYPDEHALEELGAGLPGLKSVELEEESFRNLKFDVDDRIGPLKNFAGLTALTSLSCHVPLPTRTFSPQTPPVDTEFDFYALSSLKELPLTSFTFQPETAKVPLLKNFLLQAPVLRSPRHVTALTFESYKDANKKLASLTRSLGVSPLVASLRQLTIVDSHLLPKCFEFLGALSKLQFLSIANCSVEIPPPALGLGDKSAGALASVLRGMSCLRSLSLCDLAFHATLKPTIAWKGLVNLRSLQLRLPAPSPLDLSGVACLTKLTALELGGGAAAALDLSATFARLPALRILTFVSFPASSALPALRAIPCPGKMRSLTLGLTPHERVQPSDLDAFLASAPGLTSLRIDYNPLVPDLRPLKNLRELKVSTPASLGVLAALAAGSARAVTRLELSMPSTSAGHFHREVLPALSSIRVLLLDPGVDAVILGRCMEAGRLPYLCRVKIRPGKNEDEEAMESAYLRALQPCFEGELAIERQARVRPM